MERTKQISKQREKDKCKLFESCSAPLCPIDEESLRVGIWYSDEEVCKLREYQSLPWIKMQKKIAKVKARPDRYFTLSMLKRNCVVKRGIEGLDPDKEKRENARQLKRWMSQHPPKKEISLEERQAIGKRLGAAKKIC
jgi:hypothetical protein